VYRVRIKTRERPQGVLVACRLPGTTAQLVRFRDGMGLIV
jgi:hypothetical protein